MYNIATDQGRAAWVTDLWEATSYWAHNAYLYRGRGAMVIEVRPLAVRFMPLSEIPAGELAQAVASYDPETTVVVAFEFPSGRLYWGGYRNVEDPPPQCWARVVQRHAEQRTH